jgi:hypothetical protein
MPAEPAPVRRLLAALVATTCALSACTVAATGSPVPDLPDTTSTTTSDTTNQVPPIDDPVDHAPFLAAPCSVLTTDQQTALDVREPGAATTTGATAENVGPFCTWHTNSGDAFGVGIVVGNKGGLRDIYRGRDQFDDFRPTTLDGYPAVFANSPDLRDSGNCTVLVGINDTTVVRASEQGRLDAQGACDRAVEIAVAAVATMREGL